jgi:hypothetical protein
MSVLNYSPQPKFAFPRSYIHTIRYFTDHDYAILSAGLITSGYSTIPEFLAFVFLDDRFPAWSSNRWTLDYIITSAFYWYPTPEDIHDYALNLVYTPLPYPDRGCLDIVNVGSQANLYTFHLADSDPGYWAANS